MRESHLMEILKQKSLMGVVNKYVNLNDEQEFERFIQALSGVNLDNVVLFRHLLNQEERSIDASHIKPFPYRDADSYELAKEYSRLGLDALKIGRVAFLVFSGGAATRLKEQYPELREIYRKRFDIDIGDDSDIPKGMVPVSPTGYFSFLHLFVEQVLKLQYEYGAIVNFIVMVSRATEEYIRRYFEENDYFGLMRRAVFFLRQNENPRLDSDGDIIFDGEKIITTGDGHGGVYRALIESHLADELIIRGVESIVMFNVDNPLARFFDLPRIGYHFAKMGDFTISSVEKTDPEEKIGVVAEDMALKRYRVVEYNLLTDGMRKMRDESGGLMFSCGHINVNIVNLSIIDKRFAPIIYRNKKVRVRDRQILTSSLEWLNQDIVTVLEKSQVKILGLKREDFFLPTKNVKGVDSIETTLDGLSQYYKRILDDSCRFHRNSILDISPSFILNANENHRLRNLTMDEKSVLFIRANFDIDGDRLMLNRGIHLEKNSTLKIICRNPFGKFDYDYVSNTARLDRGNASKVSIQNPIVVKRGSKVILEIEEGGRLLIKSSELGGQVHLIVKSGEYKEL